MIGDRPEERRKEQMVRVDVSLECDLSRVVKSDELGDTVDYSALADKIRRVLCQAQCKMIECAAERVAEVCMGEPVVHGVCVRLEKPGGVTGMRAAAVVLKRGRGEVGT